VDARAPSDRPARGHLGRSALKVGEAWQGPFSTGMATRRSRARKSAENKIQTQQPVLHD